MPITDPLTVSAKPDFTHWSRMARWDVIQAAALSLGFDPEAAAADSASLNPSERAQFEKLHELALNHVQAGWLPRYPAPADFLSWALSNGVDVVSDLTDAVRVTGADIADWRLLYQQQRARVEKLEAAAHLSPTPKAKQRVFLPKEQHSLLKLVLGMSIDKYGFRLGSGNSPAPQRIVDSLDRSGMQIDGDTVRKWLRVAEEECGHLVSSRE